MSFTAGGGTQSTLNSANQKYNYHMEIILNIASLLLMEDRTLRMRKELECRREAKRGSGGDSEKENTSCLGRDRGDFWDTDSGLLLDLQV